MTWRNKRDHINNYTCKWRNSDLGKTNPNHQYFMRLINKETADYLTENKDYLLANKPEVYYSMMNRKLPKKYIKEKTVVTPVNAYVPPQSKIIKEELNQILEKQLQDRRDKEQAIKIKKDKQKKEQEYRKAEIQEAIITWGISGVMLLAGATTLGFIIYMVA